VTNAIKERLRRIADQTDADIVIIDLDKEWVVDPAEFETTHYGSLYKGMKLKGRPTATFVRGNLVAENFKIVAKGPLGKVVPNSVQARVDRN